MKNVLRSLIVVLGLSLFFGIMGCDDKPTNDEKVVAEQYRGKWVSFNTSTQTVISERTYLELTDNECNSYVAYGSNHSYIAWTEGNTIKVSYANGDNKVYDYGIITDDVIVLVGDFASMYDYWVYKLQP